MGFTPGAAKEADVAKWPSPPDRRSWYPSLAWIGSPHILEGAVIQPGGTQVRTSAGSELAIEMVPKLATNLSYANCDTAAYFAGREVRMRCTITKDAFVARTIWPADFVFDPAGLQHNPLP